ncbi:sensor histidine kinase [Paenibacillus elgii]|nr:sensor histidine kinase [Paenibacillus elgii]
MRILKKAVSWQSRLLSLALVAILVPLAAELKFYPFSDSFRVGMGPPVLFFSLLWLRGLTPLAAGFVTGLTVPAFRIGLDALGGAALEASFYQHVPAFFFYFSYGALFAAAQVNNYRQSPLLIGLIGMGLEVGSNVAELFFRYSLPGRTIILHELEQIIVIAVFRSSFVLAIFNIIQLRQVRALQERERQENEHRLMLISTLYEDSVHLQKTLQQAEQITRSSYELYRGLKDAAESDFARQALGIAGQVHEIKKDNQRIYAGLSQLITSEQRADFGLAEELGGVVVRSNEKYAHLHGKSIHIALRVKGEHPPYHAYTLLSLLNNLVSNAVEAIAKDGNIEVVIDRTDKRTTELRVRDDGPGIPEPSRDIVFHPGYTTKYDSSGVPSTGIGLSYVQETVARLAGTIAIREGIGGKGTEFIIQLPLASLTTNKDG